MYVQQLSIGQHAALQAKYLITQDGIKPSVIYHDMDEPLLPRTEGLDWSLI